MKRTVLALGLVTMTLAFTITTAAQQLTDSRDRAVLAERLLPNIELVRQCDVGFTDPGTYESVILLHVKLGNTSWDAMQITPAALRSLTTACYRKNAHMWLELMRGNSKGDKSFALAFVSSAHHAGLKWHADFQLSKAEQRFVKAVIAEERARREQLKRQREERELRPVFKSLIKIATWTPRAIRNLH